jgi:NTP pyrophosphatase (non-canonical NTP hydrolase)
MVVEHPQVLSRFWQSLLEKDDRSSPADRPEYVLVSYDELDQFSRDIAQRRRDERQQVVYHWGVAAFGVAHMESLPQRGIRLLEEAIEAYQATGATAETAHKLVDYIFARPPGKLEQELGGVAITLLALATTAGLSAEETEVKELKRVLAKPSAHFAKRNEEKNAAGFNLVEPVEPANG